MKILRGKKTKEGKSMVRTSSKLKKLMHKRFHLTIISMIFTKKLAPWA